MMVYTVLSQFTDESYPLEIYTTYGKLPFQIWRCNQLIHIFEDLNISDIKGTLSSLRQFLATESTLKVH